MSNYFDDPTTGYKQYHGKLLNFPVEHGEFSFTTTGTSVSVKTYLSRILTAIITPQGVPGYNETLYCGLTVSGGYVTVSRVANETNQEFHWAIDEDQIADNDLATCPLMVAQADMTLSQVEFYKGTAFGGGTVTLDVEKYGSADYFLKTGAVTKTAGTTDTFTTSDFAQTGISDGDVIQVNTNGGTTSGPGDMVVSMQATKAGSYTSGLTFNYLFIGL